MWSKYDNKTKPIRKIAVELLVHLVMVLIHTDTFALFWLPGGKTDHTLPRLMGFWGGGFAEGYLGFAEGC